MAGSDADPRGASPQDGVAPQHLTVAPGQDDEPLALLAIDGDRAADPSVCPFLRLARPDGELVAPDRGPLEQHVCVAIGEPRPQSLRQQELLCLRSAHADCPRYLRGAAAPEPDATMAVRGALPRVPKATVAALAILVLSAGVSLGFVLQRGGLQMPVMPSDSPSAVAVVVTPSPEPTAPPVTEAPSPTPAPATPSPSPVPTASPSPVPTAAPATPTPSPATPAPSPAATSDRYAVLVPCPDQDGCWIYTVRTGDNLSSIASWFGIKLSVIYEWNPQYRTQGIRKGDEIRMPPPTR